MEQRGDRPIFSIIVSVYNREAYIADCLSSLIAQDFENYEIIVIDDGSTDGTEDVIVSFVYPKIRYVYKTHTGCWPSKNLGISIATGEFVVHVDSDDYLSNNFLSTASRLISDNPGYDYYYPERLSVVEQDGRKTDRIWFYPSYPENQRWKLIQLFMNQAICGIPHTGAFIKQDMFKRHGLYNPNLYNFGDADYIIRRADKIRFKQIPGLTHYYKRTHANQICKNYTYRNRTTAELMQYCAAHYPPSYYLPDCQKNASIEHKYKFMIDRFLALTKTAPLPHRPFTHAKKYYSDRCRG